MLVVFHKSCGGVVEFAPDHRSAFCHSCGKQMKLEHFAEALDPQHVPMSLLKDPPLADELKEKRG